MQGYWRGLAEAFSVEAVSETEALTRDLIMPWIIGPSLIVDPPDRKIPYQPWAAEIGRKGQNFHKYIDPRTACASGGVPRAGHQGASMLIHTRLGAAQVVAGQVPIALRPDNPKLLAAAAPPSPAQLRRAVATSLNTLFLAPAGIALVVGAIGIANTTLVAVLERAGEIGLRRALGARPRHIGTQFLAESTALGLFGGLVGASLGVLTTLAVTIYHQWTALVDPRAVLAAPVAGGLVGLLAGLYPALRASAVEPADALRR